MTTRTGGGPRLSIIPGAFAADDRAQLTHFRVMNLLGRHTNNAGWCVRSQIKMAAELGCARETVNRAISDLVEWGYVEKSSQADTRRSVCFYRVLLDPKVQPDGVVETEDKEGECESQITPQCDAVDHTRVTSKITGGVTQQVTPITTFSKRPLNNVSAPERASDEGARAPAAKRPATSFDLTPSDVQWSHWLTWLSDMDRRDLVLAAEEAQRMTVFGGRFPGAGSPLPRIEVLKGDNAALARRITGDRT